MVRPGAVSPFSSWSTVICRLLIFNCKHCCYVKYFFLTIAASVLAIAKKHSEIAVSVLGSVIVVQAVVRDILIQGIWYDI
jgi:hypothetical protein